MRQWPGGWRAGYVSWPAVLTVSVTAMLLLIHRTRDVVPSSNHESTLTSNKRNWSTYGRSWKMRNPFFSRIPTDQSGEEKLQLRRQQLVKQTCTSCASLHNVTSCPLHVGNTVSYESLRHLLVDDQHGAIYCVIPKVGCTNWKRVFLLTSSKMNYTLDEITGMHVHHNDFMRHFGFRYLYEFSQDDILYRLKHYYKFMFVRHPLERLLSAYRDKFTLRNKYTVYFQRKYGRKIIRRYRRNPTEKSLLDGHDVTFQEFVKYITDLPQHKEHFNPHWEPFYQMCNPCIISYDFIGNMETLATDSRMVISKLFPKEKRRLHFPNSTNKLPKSSCVLNDYYKTIPKADLEKLVEIYFPDFQLFGYNTDITFS